MTRLRTISTHRLIALCVAAVLGLAGVATIAVAATGGGPTPPPKPLAQALRDAAAAASPAGVTARVTFTNKLIDASGIGQDRNPLLSGAKGRLWISAGGDLRLELQSQGGGGDAQVVLRGDELTIFDAASNTVYRATLPPDHAKSAGDQPQDPPTLAAVKRALSRLADVAAVGEATPANIAGREAYTVRLSPRADGGLVGGASLAWDAENGVPLRAAVYAVGANDPVLELAATDVSFGAVDDATFAISPPPDATVVDLSPKTAPASGDHGTPEKPVTGLEAVRAKIGFPLSAPASLAGMERAQVALVQGDKRSGALVTYGKGLGGIAVLQTPADAAADKGPGRDSSLATVDLGGGVSATKLETALGTAITFTRGGVRYVVVGSVSGDTAVAAARGL